MAIVRRLLLAAIALMGSSFCMQAEAGKPYRMHGRRGATTFYVLPRSISPGVGSSVSKKLEYDLTFLSQSDSTSWTSTIVAKTPITSDSVMIQSLSVGKKRYALMPIYTDGKKGKYVCRLRFYVPKDVLTQLYRDDAPFTLDFGDNVIFTYSESRWDKEKSQMSGIFQIFELNK